jgi:hypothetical protein
MKSQTSGVSSTTSTDSFRAAGGLLIGAKFTKAKKTRPAPLGVGVFPAFTQERTGR